VVLPLPIAVVAELSPELCDRRSDFGAFRNSLCTGAGHYRHNLGTPHCSVAQMHGCLLNPLNLLVRVAVDLLQILTQAVKESADLFRNTCHREPPVSHRYVIAGDPTTRATKSVDGGPRLLGRNPTRIRAHLLGAVDQLDALLTLRVRQRLAVGRVRVWP
jgi:hypothetical protein